MNTTTMQTCSQSSFSLRIFLDERKCPYILCSVEIVEGKKKIRQNTIPKNWTSWSYDKCSSYNKNRADPKCTIMNINLRAANLVVVDVDDGDAEKHLNEFGNQHVTTSINRQMPHIWFERDDEDPYKTQVKKKGGEVDYLYSNVFEKVDSVMVNYDGDLDIFAWFHHIGEPKEEQKPEVTASGNKITHTADAENGEPLLDIIHIKYWTEYASWRNLIWACIDHFGLETGVQIAIKYSKLISGVYEDGCVEKVAEHFKEGLITWGTAHHFARESNPDAYALLMSPDIKPDDETLAELFLFAFGENITKDKFGNDYVFFRDSWKKSNKETANLMKQLISKETQKIMNASLKQNVKKMHELASDSPEYAKLEKICHEINDSIKRVRMTNWIRNALDHAQRKTTSLKHSLGTTKKREIKKT